MKKGGSRGARIVALVALILSIAFFITAIGLVVRHVRMASQRLDLAKASVEAQARDAAGTIHDELAALIPITEELAEEIGRGGMTADRFEKLTREVIEEHSKLFCVGSAYAPYALSPDRELYAPYWARKPDGLQLLRVEDDYDYTQPTKEGGPSTDWYHRPMKDGSGWNEPYYGASIQNFVAEYVTVFTKPGPDGKKSPAGIIYADYSLDGVRQLVGTLELGQTGYGYIVTPKGTIVSHPNQQYLGKSLDDVARTDPHLEELTREQPAGGQRVIEDTSTGRSLWVQYETIPTTGWTLGLVLVEEEVTLAVDRKIRRSKIQIALAFIAFLGCLSLLVTRAQRGGTHALAAFCASITVLFIGGTIFIWHLTVEAEEPSAGQVRVEILDHTGVDALVSRILFSDPATAERAIEQPPVRVPTGIFVRSLDSKVNEVAVTGYIWQRRVEGVEPSVMFPDATEMDLEPARQGDDVVGWSFRARVRQNLDKHRYPFERADIVLRMTHSEYFRNVVLVPDIEGYETVQPEKLPALAEEVAVRGWDIEKSYFSYRAASYDTGFGQRDADALEAVPELVLNVSIRRDFLGPLVADIIPCIIAALLAFCMLLITSSRDENVKRFGSDAATILAYGAALFFAIIISHIHFRESTGVEGLAYVECFFFSMYLAILTVSFNSILVLSNVENRLIRFRDNLVVKLLYWPLLVGTIFVVTVVVFY